MVSTLSFVLSRFIIKKGLLKRAADAPWQRVVAIRHHASVKRAVCGRFLTAQCGARRRRPARLGCVCRLVGGDVGDGVFEAIIFPGKKNNISRKRKKERKKNKTRGLFLFIAVKREEK